MSRELNILLRVVPTRPDEGCYACPDCGVPLDLSQPSTDRPEELLATCLQCLEWHLLVLDADDQATLTRLPIRPIVAASSEPSPRASTGANTLPITRSRPAARI
jgi:hypothetical protein